MKIKILYEDKNIVAIDKPAGIATHPDGRDKSETISDWFVKEYPKVKNVGESIFVDHKDNKTGEIEKMEIKKPGVVHRLDRETSGVLLLAKNKKAYELLKEQFKNREIKKTYNAVVSGFVKNDHATINKPIGRSPKDFRRWLAGRGARGEMREAITEYRVLKRFEIGKNKYSYLEIHPKTGRTHQIRVHMKFINHPVVCDVLYNPEGLCPKGFNRLTLHAKSIEFKNLKDEVIKIESLLPKEFAKIIKIKVNNISDR